MARIAALTMAGFLLAAGGALAQETETPTPEPTPTAATPVCTRTPPPAVPACGSSKIRLSWSSKRPDVATVSISATHCPQPAGCAAAPQFGGVTSPPVSVEIADSSCVAFATTFGAPASSTSGCPGREFYKGTTDKLRLIHGAATTTLAFLRLPLATPGVVPILVPPLTFQVRDASGYAIGGTASTCITTESESSLRLKCF